MATKDFKDEGLSEEWTLALSLVDQGQLELWLSAGGGKTKWVHSKAERTATQCVPAPFLLGGEGGGRDKPWG